MQGLQMFSLVGRVALVTGSVRGLGLEIARAFVSAGARVYINSRTSKDVEAACAMLHSSGGDVRPLAFDVSSYEDACAAIRSIEDESPLEILVNNVGIRHRSSVENISPGAFAAVLETNLAAPYNLCVEAARSMRLRGRGRIINLSSIGALAGKTNDAAYIAAKGGLTALTRALAAEFGSCGVTCNAIAPGAFRTETNEAIASLSDGDRPAVDARTRTALGRWGEPHEIGGAAVFLASDAGSYVTGQTLVVDGGWTTTL